MKAKYMIRSMILLAWVLLTNPVFPQNIAVTGVVRSNPENTPLPGATVLIKGTTQGTSADSDGKFTISADAGAYLVVSFIGYETQEVAVNGRARIDINLNPENDALDEIVVIGYGSQKRKDLTGSVASVNTQSLKEMPITSAEQGLQGRLAGVQVVQSNSAPGGALSVRVRGGNSVLGGSEPLYVIDGFPVYNSTGTNDGNSQPSNPMASINPNDIVSMEVLKDASATAIYGARGANGVVIITTRRGKAGAPKIDIESYYGIQTVRYKIPMLNAREYMQLANEKAGNTGGVMPFPNPANWTADTDWQDELFRAAPVGNYSLSVSGGSETSRYSISGNWFDQQGIVKGSDFKRGSIRVNLDNQLSKKLNLSTSITASKTTESRARTSISTWSGAIFMALAAPPVSPVYKDNGDFYTLADVPTAEPQWNNPLSLIEGFTRDNFRTRILANTNLTYSITPDLDISIRLGVDNSDARSDQYLSRILVNSPGQALITSSSGVDYLNENIITYKKQIFDGHNLDAMGGFTWQEGYDASVSAGSQDYASDIFGVDNLAAGSIITTPASNRSKNTLLSWLGRLNYNIDDKYLFTVSARADGSSRFGNGNKWGFFPSAAVAWRVSRERFMEDVTWIQDLKLRASTGKTGNQEIGNYNSLARLSAVSAFFGTDQSRVIGYGVTSMPNTELRWETTTQYDIGIDASLFGSKVNLSIDYYLKNTIDLLAQVPVAISSGFSSILLNSGSISNKGLEISLDGRILETTRLTWNAGINFSTNKNAVKKVAVTGGQFFASGFGSPIDGTVSIVKEGHALSSFYGYVTDGLWETDQDGSSIMPTAKAGDQRYKDLNGDGVINTEDRTILGKPNPDFFYGITNQVTLGKFDLNFLFQGVHGAMVFNANKYSIGDAFARNANQMAEVKNRWTNENPDHDALYPRASSVNPLVSDRFFEDASYFRLRNIQVGYSPAISGKSRVFQDLRVYLSAQNLITWTKYTGFDPEVSSTGGTDLRKGVDVGAYPSAKIMTLGVKLGF